MSLINSLISMFYHIQAYSGSMNFKEWIEFRRMTKVTKQMGKERIK